jgi:hypothetical protein
MKMITPPPLAEGKPASRYTAAPLAAFMASCSITKNYKHILSSSQVPSLSLATIFIVFLMQHLIKVILSNGSLYSK